MSFASDCVVVDDYFWCTGSSDALMLTALELGCDSHFPEQGFCFRVIDLLDRFVIEESFLHACMFEDLEACLVETVLTRYH